MKRTIKVKFVDGPRILNDQLRESKGQMKEKDGQEISYENHYLVNILKERYKVEFSDDPDYLFYSVYSNEYLNYKNCIRIFYTGEAIFPDFNLCDYAIGYDYLNLEDRYFRFPIVHNYYPSSVLDAIDRKIFTKEDLNKKKRFCDFIYSNNVGADFRIKLYGEISRYKEVAAAGACMNNLGYRVIDKIAFQNESKFSIACENALYKGYTTEKLGDPFIARSIPIYYGNKRVIEEFNEKAFINCHNYESIDELIARVKEIDEDDELYIDMINQPVYNKNFSLKIEEEKLKEFLYHIIEQPLEQAKRRNTGCSGYNYEKGIRNSKLKFKMYYDCLSEWLLKQDNSRFVDDYLFKLGYRNIALYGMGNIGKLLYERELKHSDKIKLKVIIDKNYNLCMDSDILLIKPDNKSISDILEQNEIDSIIVSAIYDFYDIKEVMTGSFIKCNIINFYDIIKKM